jgi:hypothetical protein
MQQISNKITPTQTTIKPTAQQTPDLEIIPPRITAVMKLEIQELPDDPSTSQK